MRVIGREDKCPDENDSDVIRNRMSDCRTLTLNPNRQFRKIPNRYGALHCLLATGKMGYCPGKGDIDFDISKRGRTHEHN